ncbi:mCG10222, isoform CRA_b, partial [Mus musculus]
ELEMESRYLQKCLGTCLTQGLTEVARVRPLDPIEYLAFWLYKHKENMNMEQMRQREMITLEHERELAMMDSSWHSSWSWKCNKKRNRSQKISRQGKKNHLRA